MVAPATTLPPRSEIGKEYTWNAESVYESRAAWQAEVEKLTQDMQAVQGFQGRLGESAAVLADWLDLLGELSARVNKAMFYALMSKSVDTTDQEAGSMAGQAYGLSGNFSALISFTEPEILQIGEATLHQWVASEPRLARFAHAVDNVFRKQAHIRSQEVEELLGLVIDPFGTVDNTGDMLTNADLQFQPAIDSQGNSHVVAQGTIGELLQSPDREVRRTAWEHYADGYLSVKNTLSSNLLAMVKRDVFFARARRYNSSLEAALFEHNIPLEVFHNLIDTYRRNLPTWHRYWQVRRKALGVDTLHPYDIWAPLTADSPVVPYQQAVEWIAEGMRPLGNEYVDILRRGCLEDRWVDVYPNHGKRQGAFSYGTQGTHPFIMMSYADSLPALSTLAHELGHSMHSYMTWRSQPYYYADYSLFVAEVASNFNQALVRDHLMKTQTERNFQIALIEEAMSNFHRYFFIMPTLARFELEVHERAERGAGVTATHMNQLMADLFSEGYGGEMHVDPERVGITWAQFGHLYDNFYVFQYATGISAAHALAKPILEGKAGAADSYLKFLSAGSSLYPIDALKLAGVDMASPDAVNETFAVLASYVDRLEQLVG